MDYNITLFVNFCISHRKSNTMAVSWARSCTQTIELRSFNYYEIHKEIQVMMGVRRIARSQSIYTYISRRCATTRTI